MNTYSFLSLHNAQHCSGYHLIPSAIPPHPGLYGHENGFFSWLSKVEFVNGDSRVYKGSVTSLR